MAREVRRILPAGPSGYCVNHDPALAEQRRANGAKRRERREPAVHEPNLVEGEPAPADDDDRLPTIRETLAQLRRIDRQLDEVVRGRRGGEDPRHILSALGKRKEVLNATLRGLQAERKREDDLRNLGEEAQRLREELRERERQAERGGDAETPAPARGLIAGMLAGGSTRGAVPQ